MKKIGKILSKLEIKLNFIANKITLRIKLSLFAIYTSLLKFIRQVLNPSKGIAIASFLLIISFILTYFAWAINSNSLRSNDVSINNFNRKCTFNNIEINYTLNDKHFDSDELHLQFKTFFLNENDTSGTIMVSVNNNLEETFSNINHFNVLKEKHYKTYFYKIHKDHPWLSLDFKGDIFNNLGSEINNHFGCNIDTVGEYFQDYKFSINGLFNYNMALVYPEPQAGIGEKDLNSISYRDVQYPYGKENISHLPVYISAEHREKKFTTQNIVFILGIIIGTFISGALELIISSIKNKQNEIKG